MLVIHWKFGFGQFKYELFQNLSLKINYVGKVCMAPHSFNLEKLSENHGSKQKTQ